MTSTAQQRLINLNGRISGIEKELSTLRQQHDEAVLNDDVDITRGLFAQITELEAEITRL